MIRRKAHLAELRALLKQFPVVCLLGARQVGKTTLARQLADDVKGPVTHYDLEDPDDLAKLSDAAFALRAHRGLVVLDEIQRRPELFPLLRVLADERPRRRRFLLLGSAAPHLLKQSSESLAGRIAFLELPGFSMAEVSPDRWSRLWLRGGFPSSFLARSDVESSTWRRSFRQTFVERDLPTLELPYTPAAPAISRLWSMLSHVHAELLNWSELGRSMGVSDLTVKRYVDVLDGALMVRQLKPWHENISKRQVKSPKLYFRDSGMLHLQLGVQTGADLESHPRVGASWEGFIIEQVRQRLGAAPEDCFFWRTENGAELDLLVHRRGRRLGFEIKRTASPSVTPSMRSALTDLGLSRLHVIHAGTETYALTPNVTALSWRDLESLSAA